MERELAHDDKYQRNAELALLIRPQQFCEPDRQKEHPEGNREDSPGSG
jgi:hypothetical protein